VNPTRTRPPQTRLLLSHSPLSPTRTSYNHTCIRSCEIECWESVSKSPRKAPQMGTSGERQTLPTKQHSLAMNRILLETEGAVWQCNPAILASPGSSAWPATSSKAGDSWPVVHAFRAKHTPSLASCLFTIRSTIQATATHLCQLSLTLSLCLSVSLSHCLSLSLSLSLCLSVSLSLCLSVSPLFPNPDCFGAKRIPHKMDD
jgi:hypothetical protein